MKVCIVTSFKQNSLTAQTFLKAALKHDANAHLINIDDMSLAQHPEGDHIIWDGNELPKYDVIVALVDVHCPSYFALLDALHHYADMVINDGQTHRSTMDELTLLKQLQKVNVQFPISVSVFKPESVEHVVKAFETVKGNAFPLLVRVLLNRHENGLIKVDSIGSLRTIVEAFCEEEIPFVIQEHAYHRGAFTGYVFGGSTLGASMTEVGNADDEFRAGLKGTDALPAKLDELDESTLARVSNAVGRALIEVCFVKGSDGRPYVMEVKPYVRFEALGHSAGLQIAEEVADRFFAGVDALMPKPEPEPQPEPEPEPQPEPEPITSIDMIIHPLNDDMPIHVNIYQGEEVSKENTIWVNDLKCDDNWISFKFNDFSYRLPRSSDSMEVSSDDEVGIRPVYFQCQIGDRKTSEVFYLRSNQSAGERIGSVHIRPEVAFPHTEEKVDVEPSSDLAVPEVSPEV